MPASLKQPRIPTIDEEIPMSRFFEMFKRSPFEPLREHMDAVMACARLVQPMFDAVGARDFAKLEALTKDVFVKEHDADLIKDEVRQTIPNTFYLPVYRGDLLGYLKLQDDIADSAEDVAVLLSIKNLELPEAIGELAGDYLSSVVKVVELTEQLTHTFQEAVEKGLQQAHTSVVHESVKAVEKAEWESDRTQYKLCKALFALENSISAVDIMLWFKIFGELGRMANVAESLADRIRRMLSSR